MKVLISFGSFATAEVLERIRAVDPDIEATACPYHHSHEEQVAREREPHAERTEELTEEQREAFGSAEVLFTLHAPLNLPTVAPNLRWVQTVGSGTGHLAPSRLADGGIRLSNAAGAGAPPIAEWVVARILEDYKRLPEHAALQSSRTWRLTLGTSLAGSTVLVVGLGAIGRQTARRLRPFDVTLLGVRRSYQPGLTDPDVDELTGPDGLDALLPRADVVVLCAPGTPENENLVDARRFALMKPGAMLVNVGRGTLVDEMALYDALVSGHLRSAAIDVTRVEPLPADDRLWDAPNLRLSPHSSVDSDRYFDRVLDLFLANLGRFRSGDPLTNEIVPPAI